MVVPVVPDIRFNPFSSLKDDIRCLLHSQTRANSLPLGMTEQSKTSDLKAELLALLKQKSVFHGEFTLASGAKSSYYIDCRLTTFDPLGATLVGQLMHEMVSKEAERRGVQIDAVGGLTMGADPVALATAMASLNSPLQCFAVRKAPKAHGQTKLVEGNFRKGDTVVVIDDVVTRGESTITAINAVVNEGGKVAFVAVLVDRQEGGRDKIEAMGYRVVSLFKRDDIVK